MSQPVCVICKVVVITSGLIVNKSRSTSTSFTLNKSESTSFDKLVSTNSKLVYPVHTECINNHNKRYNISALSETTRRLTEESDSVGYKIQHGNDLQCPPLWININQQQ